MTETLKDIVHRHVRSIAHLERAKEECSLPPQSLLDTQDLLLASLHRIIEDALTDAASGKMAEDALRGAIEVPGPKHQEEVDAWRNAWEQLHQTHSRVEEVTSDTMSKLQEQEGSARHESERLRAERDEAVRKRDAAQAESEGLVKALAEWRERANVLDACVGRLLRLQHDEGEPGCAQNNQRQRLIGIVCGLEEAAHLCEQDRERYVAGTETYRGWDRAYDSITMRAAYYKARNPEVFDRNAKPADTALKVNADDVIPGWTGRLAHVEQRTPIEHSVAALIERIEHMGGHPRLTQAQVHLSHAMCILGAWHDGGEPGRSLKS